MRDVQQSSRLVLILSCVANFMASAADCPQWGQWHSRNMVSAETGLPSEFDAASGKNIAWVAKLGTQTYSVPIVAGGNVFIGTNNDQPRNPRRVGDLGVLMCLSEKDGAFRWQLTEPKINADVYWDWPRTGMCSPPTVDGQRVYIVSNRGEVVCMDINGMANGNDGPFRDEGRHCAESPTEVDATDADILWIYDIVKDCHIRQHDSANCSVLVHGDFLYACTSNGVDGTHRKICSPDAPGLIVLEKSTGRLVARDFERMAPRTIHCTWSSPSAGVVNGKPVIFFGGGDGICYAFEALSAVPPPGTVEKLRCVWRYDCDPAAPRGDVFEWQDNRQEGSSNITGMPVFFKNRVYVAAGGDLWHGKPKSWLRCIDATGSGEITRGGALWSFEMRGHCLSTPAIHNGLVYLPDSRGVLHCLDADDGREYWSQDLRGEIWGAPLVADGKIYIGTRRREFFILAEGKEARVLCRTELDGAVCNTATVANGALYVATMRSLYCVRAGKGE